MAALAHGRPSVYSEEMALEICQRIADGESLLTICKSEHMPSRTTVMRWLADNTHPRFREYYARAREFQGDFMDDKVLDVAGCAERGEIEPQAARVAIDAYKWRAGKLRPSVYGDKTSIDVKFDGDPDKMNFEQLLVLENKLIEKACHGDPVKMEQFRRELEGPVIEGTSEVVDDGKSNVPTD